MHDGVYPTQVTYVTKKLYQLKVYFDSLKFCNFNLMFQLFNPRWRNQTLRNNVITGNGKSWKVHTFLRRNVKDKKNYIKTSSLQKKELQERRIAVKERVQRFCDRKKAFLEQIQNEISYASSSTEADTDQTILPSPMLVSIPFPKRGEASRKRKQRSDGRLYKKIKKLENEKRKLQRKCESLRKKNLSIF